MTVLSKFLGAALCLSIHADSQNLDQIQSNQLKGTPVPIALVEQSIMRQLKAQCPPGSNKPNLDAVDWRYHNEIRTVSSPYAHIPQKRSRFASEWKTNSSKIAHSNGYSDEHPHVVHESGDQRGHQLEQVNTHFRLNGALRCRDIEIVIEEEDESGNPMSRVFEQHDLMEIVNVTDHHRVPALNGQFALRATRDIPANTVLGRFCGDEMFTKEYDRVYSGTCSSQMRDHYRMTMPPPCLSPMSNIAHCIDDKVEGIVQDELGPFPANPMVIANDARRDISKPDLSEEDRVYHNANFNGFHVNGWPSLLITSHQEIRKGDEITVYYGPKYTL